MIKLSWLQIANPYFQQALRAIFDCPMLDAKTSYGAHRLQQGIQRVDKEIRDLRVELCQKYGKKDESGKLINDERGFITFETPEKNREFEEEFTKIFGERSLELKVSKLDFEKLASVRGITPSMWEHLVPIMDNLPPEDEEPVLPEIPEKEPVTQD